MLRFEIIALFILILVFTLFGLISFFIGRKTNAEKQSRDKAEWPAMFTIAGAILGGLFLFILIIVLIPFNSKYWMLTNESGEVTRVETQTSIDSEGSDSQIVANIVLTIDSDKVVIMDDPRAQNIKVGDNVNLRCQTHWVYGGSDQITCIPN